MWKLWKYITPISKCYRIFSSHLQWNVVKCCLYMILNWREKQLNGPHQQHFKILVTICNLELSWQWQLCYGEIKRGRLSKVLLHPQFFRHKKGDFVWRFSAHVKEVNLWMKLFPSSLRVICGKNVVKIFHSIKRLNLPWKLCLP